MLRSIILFCFLCCSGKIFSQQHIDSIITLASLKENVTALAHDSMKGRLTTSPELYNAAVYIQEQFKKAGLKPVDGNDGFFWKYYHRGKPGTPGVAANVMGAIQGDTGKIVIFSAHFDHVGTIQRGIMDGAQIGDRYDTIYNGANDNASGVAALIELAKYYAARKTHEYSVLFIAFSGEEAGLIGSRLFAREVEPGGVALVINMDMIGRPAREAGRKPFVTGTRPYKILAAMNRNLYAADAAFGKHYFESDPFPKSMLDVRSDHASFEAKGIQAVSVMTSSPNDKYYHSPNDETGTIDFPFLHKVAKAIALACEPLLRK